MNTIPVKDWISAGLNKEFIELPNYTIQSQLEAYDKAGTGIGFILILLMLSTDSESDNPEATHVSMTSMPIVKLRNEWATIEDENLADMVAGLIRMIAPSVKPEQAEQGEAAACLDGLDCTTGSHEPI